MINNYVLAQQGLVQLGPHCLFGLFAQQGLVQSGPQALVTFRLHLLYTFGPGVYQVCNSVR